MNIKKDEYIIVELIPSNLKEKDGIVVQISALKIKGLKLQERFDYRLNDEALPFLEMKNFINYDNNQFHYVDSEDELWQYFQTFVQDIPLLILDNIYTPSFLSFLKNEKKFILDYLHLIYHKEIISELKKKYHLNDSNHIVDLLYEALMIEY